MENKKKYNVLFALLCLLILNVRIQYLNLDFIDSLVGVCQAFEEDKIVVDYIDVKADTYYIEAVIRNYENNIIYAINENDFSCVEGYLLPNSDLYKSQKRLISYLNSKKIKEELNNYSIEDIVENKDGFYKVYVYENIDIIYPDGRKVTKEYYWIYTVVPYKMPKKLRMSSEIDYRLSKIEKWNKK